MLIGIDASRATSANPTGTETYSRELIRALLNIDHANTYRLYTREPAPTGMFPSAPSVQVRAIPFPRLWTHFRLSVEMARHPPGVLIIPAHVLPLVHPARSVVTVHDLGHVHFPEAYTPSQRLYHRWSTSWNCRSAWHILADSEATRDDVLKFYGISLDKTTVVYPALSTEFNPPQRDLGRAAEVRSRLKLARDYVLSIGTIHPRKNYARLIHAFAQLLKRRQDCDLELVVVGKRGWLYRGILDLVGRLGMKDRVRFLDYVAESDLPAVIGNARLFAFPSLHEGFGIPVLEAQACGTPVICSMTSAFPEVAGDGALFVDPFDVDALSAGMERLVFDESLRSKLIAHGLENVKRFSWENSAARVLQVLEEASGDQGP